MLATQHSRLTRWAGSRSPGKSISTGWPQVDRALGGGLVPGVLHEWFAGELGMSRGRTAAPSTSAAPLMVLTHLVNRAISSEAMSGKHVLWIGKAAWPHAACFDALKASSAHAPHAPHATHVPHAPHEDGADDVLRPCPPQAREWFTSPSYVNESGQDWNGEGNDLLSRSIFVDPPDDKSRLWAIDLCLRNPSVAVVVADGRGLTMGSSRRLQLAAESGNTLALITRPASERNALSAASTRWHVHRTIAPEASLKEDRAGPRWMLELLRCKGRARGSQGLGSQGLGSRAGGGAIPDGLRAWADFYVPSAETQRWWVEWNSATGVVSELSELVDRSVDTSRTTSPEQTACSRMRARPNEARAIRA